MREGGCKELPALCMDGFGAHGEDAVEGGVNKERGEFGIPGAFDEAVFDTVDGAGGREGGGCDFVWADADEGAVALMEGVYVAAAGAGEGGVFEREVRIGCEPWAWDLAQTAGVSGADGLEQREDDGESHEKAAPDEPGRRPSYELFDILHYEQSRCRMLLLPLYRTGRICNPLNLRPLLYSTPIRSIVVAEGHRYSTQSKVKE